MPTGKVEVTCKFSELPAVETTANGWKQFVVADAAGNEITITMRPKFYAKIEQAAASWPAWVAAVVGKIGTRTEKGFTLDEPAVQVFEKKPKADAAG